MSIYNALYGRDGHGVDPGEPEKKGFARFCQMVGRDLGQLLGTNLMVCILCLPAALGVSLGVTLFSLPITVVCSAVTGLLVGPAMVLLADCALRSLQNDPSQWLPRAKQTLAAHWKAACGFGCIGTLVLGIHCQHRQQVGPPQPGEQEIKAQRGMTAAISSQYPSWNAAERAVRGRKPSQRAMPARIAAGAQASSASAPDRKMPSKSRLRISQSRAAPFLRGASGSTPASSGIYSRPNSIFVHLSMAL